MSHAIPNVVGKRVSRDVDSDDELHRLQPGPNTLQVQSARNASASWLSQPKFVQRLLLLSIILSFILTIVIGVMVFSKEDETKSIPAWFFEASEHKSVLFPLGTLFNSSEVATSLAKRRAWSYDVVSRLEARYNSETKMGTLHHEVEPFSKHGHSRFDMLGPIGPRCPKQLSSFGRGDDEKRICDLGQLKDSPEGCTIISIGSKNKWGFEEAVYDQTTCHVHTFDCTGNWGNWAPPERIATRVTFHNVCIAAEDSFLSFRKFRAWTHLLLESNLSRSPAYLKMDIEGYEWDVLTALFRNAKSDLLPDQIALELHYKTQMDLPWRGRYKSAGEIALFGQMLFEAGYFIIDRHDNPACHHCSEILIARLRHRSR